MERKCKVNVKKVAALVIVLLVVVVAGVTCKNAFGKGKEPVVITVTNSEGTQTQYVQEISGQEDFIDKVAWVNANNYKLVENTYPKCVYYTDQGGNIQTQTAADLDQYVEILLTIKYSDNVELYKDFIPKNLFYTER